MRYLFKDVTTQIIPANEKKDDFIWVDHMVENVRGEMVNHRVKVQNIKDSNNIPLYESENPLQDFKTERYAISNQNPKGVTREAILESIKPTDSNLIKPWRS